MVEAQKEGNKVGVYMCGGVRYLGGAGYSATAGPRTPCTDGKASPTAAATPGEYRDDNRTDPYLLHSAGNVLLELGGRGRLLRRQR